jgi:hypothetical protein
MPREQDNWPELIDRVIRVPGTLEALNGRDLVVAEPGPHDAPPLPK